MDKNRHGPGSNRACNIIRKINNVKLRMRKYKIPTLTNVLRVMRNLTLSGEVREL